MTGVNETELTPCDTSMSLEDESKNPIVGSKRNNTALNSVPTFESSQYKSGPQWQCEHM